MKVLENRILGVEHVAKSHLDMAQKHENILMFLMQDLNTGQETL